MNYNTSTNSKAAIRILVSSFPVRSSALHDTLLRRVLLLNTLDIIWHVSSSSVAQSGVVFMYIYIYISNYCVHDGFFNSGKLRNNVKLICLPRRNGSQCTLRVLQSQVYTILPTARIMLKKDSLNKYTVMKCFSTTYRVQHVRGFIDFIERLSTYCVAAMALPNKQQQRARTVFVISANFLFFFKTLKYFVVDYRTSRESDTMKNSQNYIRKKKHGELQSSGFTTYCNLSHRSINRCIWKRHVIPLFRSANLVEKKNLFGNTYSCRYTVAPNRTCKGGHKHPLGCRLFIQCQISWCKTCTTQHSAPLAGWHDV